MLLFIFTFKAGKTLQTQNPTVHPNGVAPATYVAQGFDAPPEQCHPFENPRHVGGGGQT